MRIEYHRTLLADRVRNAAFHAALERLIVKGETTVADVGAGTGFLGFLAARLGARRVDLYEAAGVAGVARKLLRHNRVRNCRIIEMHSTEVVDPDRVDLIVCETLGNYALEENIVETLNDARARFLQSGGTIIPAAIRQYVCPIVSERFLAELAAWDSVGYGLDFGPAKAMSLNNIYVRAFAAGDLLDAARAARLWDQLSFARHNKTTRAGALELGYGLVRSDLAEIAARRAGGTGGSARSDLTRPYPSSSAPSRRCLSAQSHRHRSRHATASISYASTGGSRGATCLLRWCSLASPCGSWR